jgi:hypothetical protein
MPTSLITEAPAPWQLRGRAYVSMLHLPDEVLDQGSFLPLSLQGKRKPSPHGYLMFVDYAASPVGPYHELLFIPGSFRFEDGRNHLSISRIFVSSIDSVVNGNRNWGIPKDVAEFDVRYDDAGVDRVTVSKDGKVFAQLAFKHYPMGLPIIGWMVPERLRTLGQHDHGKTYIYSPSASSLALMAKLVEARFDPAMFPDASRGKPVLTVYLPNFRMLFPPARVIEQVP